MMYLKIVSSVDDRSRIFEANDIQYKWLTKEEQKNPFISSRATYCFGVDGDVSDEYNVEFWIYRNGESRQIFMGIGRRAYIMNENGKTIDKVN